jgi:hypothetical protein
MPANDVDRVSVVKCVGCCGTERLNASHHVVHRIAVVRTTICVWTNASMELRPKDACIAVSPLPELTEACSSQPLEACFTIAKIVDE